MQKKVLMAFDDPGGGLAVSSLIDRLREEKYLSMEIYSGKLSEKFLKERNINFKKLQSKITRQEAINITDNEMPDILLTGTSGGNSEQELRNAASERGIKSVVILDFWKDYSRRWLYASYPVEKMKDKVCVMDEITKEEMMSEKFPEGNLLTTGHPYLDKIFNPDKNEQSNINSKNTGSGTYLFLSQPLGIIGIKDYKEHPVKFLIDALVKLSEFKKEKIILKIKLHPSENMTSELLKLSEIQSDYNFELMFADETKSLTELINESEVVIGYSTIAMFEARAAGKRTVSLSFSEVKESLIKAMNEAGIETVSGNAEEIFDCLNKDSNNSVNKEFFKGGIENCVKVILEQLN